jgi:hypothetical protein
MIHQVGIAQIVVPLLQNKGDKIMQIVNFVNSILANNDLPMMTADENIPTLYTRTLVLGSCEINIGRNTTTDTGIRFFSLLVELPKENILPLYRFLLEQNSELWGNFTFSVNGEYVVGLKYINNVSELSPEDFMAKLQEFGSTADKYDDEISSRFGAGHVGYKLGLG